MSNESMTAASDSSSSGIRQFGLYRSIDSRTEEFLRLSRKRQIRQGCACAAISTTVTVTIVIVILLIYEYAIAVESSLVQKVRAINSDNYNKNITNDSPIADRLDRGLLGFDQDYYERMPLLVNAMQENSYIDTIVESTLAPRRKGKLHINHTRPIMSKINYKISSIRRTSPRPFIFEYRSPTPTPFSKTYGSRSWVENYRNTQRVKNLQQVISYLEKTINAKFGDIYPIPKNTGHIAFSGVYVQPVSDTKSREYPTTPIIDLLLQESNKVDTKANHKSDPLFSYKPDNPGDVNLLADGFLRFAPVPTPSFIKEKTPKLPMFRPISHRKRNCIGIICDENLKKRVSDLLQDDINTTETPNVTPKSFSVMLNLIPLHPNIGSGNKRNDAFENVRPFPTLHNIYFTTPKPKIGFRRKSVISPISRDFQYKTSRRSGKNSARKNVINVDSTEKQKQNMNTPTTGTKMIVHVNVYPPKLTELNKNNDDSYSNTTPKSSDSIFTSEFPVISATHVEDFHVGSSGIIPIESRQRSELPKVNTVIPFFSSSDKIYASNNWPTSPPDILKFSHEDAKVPDEYKKLLEEEKYTKNEQPSVISRRHFRENFDEDGDEEPKTIVIKLKNEPEVTTHKTVESTTPVEAIHEVTTLATYVPQINGHYRNVKRNYKNVSNWAETYLESETKRTLNISDSDDSKHVKTPTYVEIKRNKTRHFTNN